MFRWTTTQPVGEEVDHHLEQCGGIRAPWHEREPWDVLVYQSPHQVIRFGRLPYTAILTSYEMILRALKTEQHKAIHSERLLNCNRSDLESWAPGQPLPTRQELGDASPLEGVITSSIIAADSRLAVVYQTLEFLGERGESLADLNYAERLQVSSAEELIKSWNTLMQKSGSQNRASHQTLIGELQQEYQKLQHQRKADLKQLEILKQERKQWAKTTQQSTTLLERLIRGHQAQPGRIKEGVDVNDD